MRTPLGHLVQISSGWYQKTVTDGNALYLTGKHFRADGSFDKSLVKLNAQVERRDRRHLLREDDLLIYAKGEHNRVVRYRESFGPAAASSLFSVLRLMHFGVDVEYLRWFLNHPLTQQRLRSLSRGSGIPSLSKAALKDLMIPVPPLERQRAIVRTYTQWEQERQQLQQLIELKNQYYQTLLLEASQNEPSNAR